MTARRPISIALALAAAVTLVPHLTGQVPKPKPAAKTSQAPPPAPLDTSLTTLPAGFAGSSYDAVGRYLLAAGAAPGFYAIRLNADGLCEDHPVKATYDTERKRLSIMFDGAHSSSTPGIELLCSRKIVGELTVTPASGPKFRAARIIERGHFVVPMETELRWQSHFEIYAEMPQPEAEALLKRMAYYLVVQPAVDRIPSAVVVDSTREAATPDRPDDLTKVQAQIYASSSWLYAVDPTTRRVIAKGPLLPGSCP